MDETKKIDKGVRLTNYLIDTFIIVVVWIIIVLVFQPLYLSDLAFFGLMFVYYILFESISGQTIGKLITKTIVVNKKGSHPNFIKILMRTILRFVPFDGFSYLFGTENGLHDTLSLTKLVRKVDDFK